MKAIFFGGAVLAVLATTPALAAVDIAIDLSTQHMHVTSATGSYDWPVSTARAGYVTPTGTFAPQRLASVYYSKKYDNAPMPHAIFFYYGFAIHGSYEVKHLGHPASHGCVRLAPGQRHQALSTMVEGRRRDDHHHRRAAGPGTAYAAVASNTGGQDRRLSCPSWACRDGTRAIRVASCPPAAVRLDRRSPVRRGQPIIEHRAGSDPFPADGGRARATSPGGAELSSASWQGHFTGGYSHYLGAGGQRRDRLARRKTLLSNVIALVQRLHDHEMRRDFHRPEGYFTCLRDSLSGDVRGFCASSSPT